jgi:hypothetical protein
MVRRAALAVVAGTAIVFGGVTWLALEGGEVVILRTLDAQGQVRRTRTWVADEGGDVWIEAANDERQFLADLRRNPDVELQRGGGILPYRAVVVANPQGHDHIRRLLLRKYGWADWWIGCLTDTSASLAVRLQPRSD